MFVDVFCVLCVARPGKAATKVTGMNGVRAGQNGAGSLRTAVPSCDGAVSGVVCAHEDWKSSKGKGDPWSYESKAIASERMKENSI